MKLTASELSLLADILGFCAIERRNNSCAVRCFRCFLLFFLPNSGVAMPALSAGNRWIRRSTRSA